jgi:GNAT superfamily N-acetyltransferase
MSLRHLQSHADLLAASNGDAFVRYDIPVAFSGPGFALGGAVAALRHTHLRRLGLMVIGGPDEVGRLMAALMAEGWLEGLPVRHVTVTRGALEAVARHLPLRDGNEWEWMYAGQPPSVTPAEERLVSLGECHEAEISALLAEANPRTDARPFRSDGQRWVGARDGGGRLVACGLREPNVAGYPILNGITVHPAHRGTGLGLAVTACLTRLAVREAGICTLGLYSDNAIARRVYHGLGYGGDHLWSSRRLVR